MPFVIAKAEYRTIPEALRRLWYRNHGHAALIVANVIVGWLIGLALLIGLPVTGVYLTIAGGVIRIVIGVVITLTGPVMAQRFKLYLQPRLLMLAWLVVDAAVATDTENAARLTRYEREAVEALRKLVGRVIEAARITAQDGRWDRLLLLRTEWPYDTPKHVKALSRGQSVTQRLDMVGKLLIDGSQRPSSALTFAPMIAIIGNETDRAFANLLAGEPVEQDGTTWPVNYEQGRLDDLANYGGEPVSLQKLLDARAP